jgi:hypothetical protein
VTQPTHSVQPRADAKSPRSVLGSQSLVCGKPTVLAFAVAILICASHQSASAEPSGTEQSVEAAKQALAGGGKFPWYDSASDDVRRLNMRPRQSLEEREATWTDNKTRTATTAPPAQRVSYFGKILQVIGLTTLVILLGLIAYLVATAFLKEELNEDAATVRRVVESRRDADRVEALPFQIRAAAGDFLTEARRLYEAGDYSQAIVYLFSHQLVQLDKHHVIRLTKGKTNRQYLRETRHRPPLAGILETTMIAFEDAFFGNKTLSRETFERCWQHIDEFETTLARQELAAA